MESKASSLQSKIKSSKERSRDHRRRKKEYYSGLEAKIKQLQMQIEALKEENIELRQRVVHIPSKISEQASHCTESNQKHALQISENYLYNTMKKNLKKEPEEVRFSMIEQSVEEVRDCSEIRINYIKQCFSNIINNIASVGSKAFSAIFNEMKVKDYAQCLQAKKRKRKYFEKEVETAKDIFLAYEFSEITTKNFLEYKNKTYRNCKKLKNMVHQIARVRNELLNCYKEIQKDFHDAEAKGDNEYTKEDVSTCLQIWNRMKEKGLLSAHNVWEIPYNTKTNEADFYEGAELTDTNT
ncbi:unnamed protein product [Moneuplotes crassus]|uniref:BZIP domain-containing protein n=1 Tax=Euplotes crassus TaxID=5936 RepID=A0AAD1XMA3_EUPCR|nr:unnamed protein product [Moneuplotes crassus]